MMIAKSQGFTFKQFYVRHDRCAMKVGTDAILLGAWADVSEARCILDLGTGTGLLALMLAQRSHHDTKIIGVEIDPQAAEQARENVASSPWATRIHIEQQDITAFAQRCEQNSVRFDVIVANPPYFEQGVNCRTDERNTARYTLGQSHLNWLHIAQRCLTDDGLIHFVLPMEEGETLIKSTALYCVRRCDVVTKMGKRAQRVLLTFQRQKQECIRSKLIIYNEKNQYSPDFIRLTKDFYLHL